MSCYLLGPPEREPTRLLILGLPAEQVDDLCVSPKSVARTDAPFAHPLEHQVDVYYCSEFKQPLSGYWPQLRSFDHTSLKLD